MTKKQTSKIDPQDMERQIKFHKNLMKTVGLNPDETGGNVIFTGPGDPLYDSSYHFAEGQSAILAAIGSAISQVWQLRGGKPQDITVNRYRALHSLHRPGFLKQNGYPIILSAPFNSTGMTHQCGDGRFFETTTTTRHLELGMLQLLDTVLNINDSLGIIYLNRAHHRIDSLLAVGSF